MDNRKYTRFSTKYPAVIKNGDRAFPGLVHNLSAGGAFIYSEEQLGPNQSIKLIVDVPASIPLHLNAKVVWIAECETAASRYPYSVGVQF